MSTGSGCGQKTNGRIGCTESLKNSCQTEISSSLQFEAKQMANSTFVFDTHTYVSWTTRTDHIIRGEMKQGEIRRKKKRSEVGFEPRTHRL